MGLADTNEWDLVIQNAYGLQPEFFVSSEMTVKFYIGSSFFLGSYLATAPYLTDGGCKLNEPSISDTTVDEIQAFRNQKHFDYALIRTRQNILDSGDPDIHVDRSQFSFLMDLTIGQDTIWDRNLDSKTRNQIRKGLKADLVLKIGGIELSVDFFGVISQVWRALGTPTHKKRFYEMILEVFQDRSRFVVLYLQGRPISAALIVIENNILYHPYAGTLTKFNALSANNVLYWNIIKYGCERDCDAFDMGRSLLDSGTYRYKRSWGAKPVQLFYTYFMSNGRAVPESNTLITRSMVNAWKFLPVKFANLLGPGLIKGVL